MTIENSLQNLDNLLLENNAVNFTYNTKKDYTKSSLKSLDFTLPISHLNQKALQAVKILESFSSNETLVKFDLFRNVIKVSALHTTMFADVLFKLQNPIEEIKENEYFSFVIASDLFIKFISVINEGELNFSIDYSSQTLVLKFQTLLINLQLKAPSEFLDYESLLEKPELCSNIFSTDKIKNAIDFSNLIFSKAEETNKLKEINLSKELVFALTTQVGSSGVKFENFGEIDYVINHGLIKVFSQMLSLFKESDSKIFKTDKFIVFKDSNILFGTPIPVNSNKELKTKINKVSFEMDAISKVSVNRKTLIQSLTALSILLKDLQDDLVKFTFNNNTLKVSVIDQVTNKESFDTFTIIYSGPEKVVNLKFDNILKNLKFFINRELVDFEVIVLSNNSNGIRITETHLGVSYSTFFISCE